MARRKSFSTLLNEAARLEKRKKVAQQRAVKQQLRAAEKARKDYERAKAAGNKEAKRLYTESQIAEVAAKNSELEDLIKQLENLLSETLSSKAGFDLGAIKRSIEPPIPQWPKQLEQPESPPILQKYLPPEPVGVQRLLPGNQRKHAEATAKAHAQHQADVLAHAERETRRQRALAQARDEFEKRKQEHQRHLAEIDKLQADFAAGHPSAIVEYFTLVLETTEYPEGFPQKAKLAYVPDSRQLVVEYDLPPYEIVPEVGEFKYTAKTDEITTKPRSDKQRKSLYSALVAQVTLRTLYELFAADTPKHLDALVFNGMVDTIDKGTGRPVRPCLVTVRTTRDVFLGLDLSKVDPAACLKVLSASVSKSPAELTPVRPVLEFNMVDPRFIEETDVISTLDTRSNLMELTPSEFESLITNLFEKMGLETRQTQASRDGGVDCVAFDPRPIFGGKVVIQAKRYKHTVGVNAVRDLYGTMQNEGASKGILVTTSGYGKASFEFAAGKPLELLDGSNLLYLLSQHAGIEAKIEPPEGWKDPQADIAEEPPYNQAKAD